MILDLRDKVSLEDTLIHKEMQVSAPGGQDNHAVNEAVEALTALGYSATDALQAVKKVPADDNMDVETVLKLALKNMF